MHGELLNFAMAKRRGGEAENPLGRRTFAEQSGEADFRTTKRRSQAGESPYARIKRKKKSPDRKGDETANLLRNGDEPVAV